MPPPPTWVLCLISFNAHSTCFKLSVHEVVSFIIITQVKLVCFLCPSVSYPCCLISLTFVAGVGGKLSRAVYLAPPPPPTWVLCLISFNAHSTCFKLSVHEVVSFIIITQVKLGCFLCPSVSYPCCLISLTFVAGLGGKLSRAVYLAPPPPPPPPGYYV